MRIVHDLPRPVREVENVFIPMSDGCRLAARIWLPEGAVATPVPAIVEYIPYRKRDGTRLRDEPMHNRRTAKVELDAMNHDRAYVGHGPLLEGVHMVRALCADSLAARALIEGLRGLLYRAAGRPMPRLGRMIA